MRHGLSLQERLTDAAERGMRIAKYMALSFAVAVVAGIGIGAWVADNAFVQIFVTFLATLGLWLPILLAALAIDSRFRRPRASPEGPQIIETTAVEVHWARLERAAPTERNRIGAIQRSLATSHFALREARLDPDAHDLCVLIDRRLPELIEKELDALPPGDRERQERLSSLIGLVEDFARHCGRKRDGNQAGSEYQAEVLRRRFEERLAAPSFKPQ